MTDAIEQRPRVLKPQKPSRALLGMICSVMLGGGLMAFQRIHHPGEAPSMLIGRGLYWTVLLALLGYGLLYMAFLRKRGAAGGPRYYFLFALVAAAGILIGRLLNAERWL